jgi:hypothetical protein
VYWLLPLNAEAAILSELEEITAAAIRAALG